MTRMLAAAVGCGLLLSGCAGVGVRQAPKAVVATFDEKGMTGQSVSLQRDGSAIRGTAYGRAVSLQWTGTDVTGSYRSMPVKLAVAPAGEATKVEGEFDGESAAFQYTANRLEGYLSGCAFLFERAKGNQFEGKRACANKKPEARSLAVPLQLANASETERAAWLTLLLTDESVEPSFARAQVVLGVNKDKRQVRTPCKTE